MNRTILIGAFITIQAVAALIYFMSLAPLAGPDAAPFTSQTMQVWSGGARADIVDSFRRGPAESATPFDPLGLMLWATLLLAGSAATAWLGRVQFGAGRVWVSAGLFAVTLAAGAGAAALIITHWGGSVLYAPGSPNVAWLYMATRAFLLHLLVGYVLLIIATGLVVFDVARPHRPMGVHLVAVNWVIVAAVWLGAYLVLYLGPALTRVG